jgi:hypothetical protein
VETLCPGQCARMCQILVGLKGLEPSPFAGHDPKTHSIKLGRVLFTAGGLWRNWQTRMTLANAEKRVSRFPRANISDLQANRWVAGQRDERSMIVNGKVVLDSESFPETLTPSQRSALFPAAILISLKGGSLGITSSRST